jgi:predicted alpha/beta superfamily hydrolase
MRERDIYEARLHYAIALPPGYASSGKRYPVVYVLHGPPRTTRRSGRSTRINGSPEP